jgi:hypothetical protein
MNEQYDATKKLAESAPAATGGSADDAATERAVTGQELRKAEKNIEERMTAFERSMIRLTRYGLAVTVLTGIIFAGQLYEMITGGTATDKLVQYAKTQANAGSDISDAAQEFSDTAEEINSEISESRDALNATNKQNRAALNATLAEMRTQTRLAVRPYVGLNDDIPNPVGNGQLHIDDKGNASMLYGISAKNFSGVPAQEVASYANLVITDDLYEVYRQRDSACKDDVIGKPDIGSTLFQGRNRVFMQTLAMTTVKAIHTPKPHDWYQFSVWLTGCIGYRDQFGYLYRTQFIQGMVDSTGNFVRWQGPPKGPLDITGRFVDEGGGKIDAGKVPKYK